MRVRYAEDGDGVIRLEEDIMIGRLCNLRRRHTSRALSGKEVKARLLDYVCPDCGWGSYHLIFRAERLSGRVSLLVACDACHVRKSLPNSERVQKLPVSITKTIESTEAG